MKPWMDVISNSGFVPLAVNTWMFATWVPNQNPCFHFIFIQLWPIKINIQYSALTFKS